MCYFSIIVPIYNAEEFLEVTLRSILNQTYKNFELLLINDGSTDSSLRICKLFAEEDHRIKVFDKINEGVSKTRNYGIDKASGDYIMFFDADDEMEENSLDNFKKLMSDFPGREVYSCNFCMRSTMKESVYITKYENYNGPIGSALDVLVKGDLYLRPGSYITNSRQKFNTKITIYEDTDYIFNLIYKKEVIYGDFVGMSYLLTTNGASRKFHRYENEWIVNVDPIFIRKYFLYFLKHLLQRLYLHLKSKDYDGTKSILLNFIMKILK